MWRYRLRQLAMLGAVAVLLPQAAEAQRRSTARELSDPAGLLGITALVARPVGEFRSFVDWGGGIGLYGVVNFDRGRHVGLRFDGSYVMYGHERFSVPLSLTIPRVWVDVTTTNSIASLGIGPQLTLARGPFRPYVYGTAGFSYFATVSSVGDTDFYYDDVVSSTNFDDVTLALTAGGGILLRLSRGRHPVALDLSAQTTYNGEAEYLRKGGIIDRPDGSVFIQPIRSEANLVVFRMGVAIGL